MDIKKLIGKRIGIYERKIDMLQSRLGLIPEEEREKSKTNAELMEWYYRDEELLDLLREIKRVEEDG